MNWFPMLNVPFMNDDFQIIGNTIPTTFYEIFSPLWSIHSWGYYWRPLVKVIYNLLLFTFGFNPYPFHFTALTLYAIVPGLVAILGSKLGLSFKSALISGILFALLPSHELQSAWLSDMVENLTAIFILLFSIKLVDYFTSQITSTSNILLILVFFLFALLSKEIGFALLGLPFLKMIFFKKYGNESLKGNIYLYTSMIFLFLFYLLYRIVIIESNPFQAVHFHSTSLMGVIKNFLLYIPVSFVSPDLLEIIFYNWNLWTLILIVIVALSFFLMIAKVYYRKLSSNEIRIVYFSLTWFVLFIVPVLPAFMRWYSFIASIGFTWVIGLFGEKIYTSTNSKKLLIGSSSVIVFLLFYYNLQTSFNWVEAGEKMNRIAANIRQNQNSIDADTIYVWGMPDKYKRVPMMKLGAQQTFEFLSDNKNIEIISPLRTEIALAESQIHIVKDSTHRFQLICEGGRFLLEGGRSRKVLINEKIDISGEHFQINISNELEETKYPVAKAIIILSKNITKHLHLFYDGNDFRKIKFNIED